VKEAILLKFYSVNNPKKLREKSDFVITLMIISSLTRKQQTIAFHLRISFIWKSLGVFHGQGVTQKLLLDDCFGVVKGTGGIRTLFLSFCHSSGYMDVLSWGTYFLNPGTMQQVEERAEPTGQSAYHKWSKLTLHFLINLVWEFGG